MIVKGNFKDIFKGIASVLLMVLTIGQAGAQKIDITESDVVAAGDRLLIDMVIVTPEGLESSGEVTVTPMLTSEKGDTLFLPSVLLAGRNKYYTLLRQHDKSVTDRLHSASKTASIKYNTGIKAEEWMLSSKLEVNVRETHCCDKPDKTDLFTAALIDLLPKTEEPEPVVAVTEPKVERVEVKEAPKTRILSGKAYLDFKVNRTDIDLEYGNNMRELDSIAATIAALKKDPDVTVDSIVICGYASPEGNYANNRRLAEARTKTVAEYVKRLHNFSSDQIKAQSVAEDWEGLAERLSGMEFAGKEEIIQLAKDISLDPDIREARIKKDYPEQYEFILKTIYPKLRHTDYTIHYRVR